MNFPHEFDVDQLMYLMDIATDTLEEIAEETGRAAELARLALDKIARRTMEFMEGQK